MALPPRPLQDPRDLAVGPRTVIGHHAYVERWNHEYTDFGLAD
jgi:hypothetical protein